MDRRLAEQDLERDSGHPNQGGANEGDVLEQYPESQEHDPQGRQRIEARERRRHERGERTAEDRVTPPVGSGSAGTPSSSTNKIAKLRFLKSSMRLPSVLSLPAARP
jgi:hypothetical protein